MGLCSSCFDEPSTDEGKIMQPDNYSADHSNPEERRMKMLEAAEKRREEQEARGLHNPDRVKAKQRRVEELEKKQEQLGGYQEGGGLRWQIN